MKISMQKFNQVAKEYYILFMLILLMGRAIGPYSLIPSIMDSVLYGIAAIIGCLFIAIDLINIVLKKKVWNYNWWLISFLIVILLSSIINRSYGITGNIKLLVWQAIYFFVIFEVGQDDQIFSRLIKKFINILLSTWFVLSLISFIMFVCQYSYAVQLENRARFLRIGFYGARLFGTFEDPNFGSTICVVVIIFSFAYLSKKVYDNRWISLLLKINIVLQFIYIVLSGSRTGAMVLISVFFVYSFFKIFYSHRLDKQSVIIKVLLAVFLSAVGSGIIYISIDIFKSLLAYIPELLSEVKTQTSTPVDLTRPDVEDNSDVSNGRLALWQSGIELFKSSWLFGTSPRNILTYASEVLPQTFIAKTQKYTHNSYVNILASTGLLGSVSLLGFMILRVVEVLKRSFSKINGFFNEGLGVYVLSVLAVAVSGMFLNDIVLVNTLGALIFWLFLGRVMYLSKQSK